MILIPIGHEAGDSVRRLPWVTFSIIGLCLVALLATAGVGLTSRSDREMTDRTRAAAEYWVEHPYLDLDPAFAAKIGFDGPFTDDAGEAMRQGYMPPAEVRDAEQAELDRLTAAAMQAVDAHPLSRFGLTPADIGLVSLLTHMFLHAGWLHLIGNMLLLYLTGPFIEDVWGRAVYGAFYVVAGIVAALVFVAGAPGSTVPLVGASGAIAGVMGAFLVRYWHTRITFFYMVGLFLRGTFAAPAWLMLPLWFGEQVLMAMLAPAGESGGGVAYVAHIGGFLFGVGVAFAIRHQRLEEHWFEPALARAAAPEALDNGAIDRAMSAFEQGDADGAMVLLADETRRRPSNPDVVLAYWHVAAETGRGREAVAPMARLIQHDLARGARDEALARWDEVAPHADGGVRLDAGFCTRLAGACADVGRADEAVSLLRRALLSAGSRLDPSQALGIARVGRHHEPSIAAAALRLALARPDLEAPLRARLEQALAELPAGYGVPASSGAAGR